MSSKHLGVKLNLGCIRKAGPRGPGLPIAGGLPCSGWCRCSGCLLGLKEKRKGHQLHACWDMWANWKQEGAWEWAHGNFFPLQCCWCAESSSYWASPPLFLWL